VASNTGTHSLRLDRRRFAALLPQISFKADSDVARVPTFSEIKEILASTYGKEPPDPEQQVPDQPPQNSRAGSSPWNSARSPCADCTAACCRALYFKQEWPQHYVDFDRMRYKLGFPGVTYSVSGEALMLVVATTCMHLNQSTGQCNVFSDPIRPKHCEFMNEWKCAIRDTFVLNTDRTIMIKTTVDLERLENTVSFDSDGSISAFPLRDKQLQNVV
jgi:hypothetical protein